MDRAFALVKEWSLDVLYNLNPRRPELREAFLSNFLVATKLGLRIDMHDGHFDVARSLPSIPCTTVSAHPALWIGRPFYSRYALPLFANFLRGAGDVRDGVEFLWCVHFTPLYTTQLMFLQHGCRPPSSYRFCDFMRLHRPPYRTFHYDTLANARRLGCIS